MSISALSSYSASANEASALLGQNSSSSPVSSLLGTSSSSGTDAVTVDLSNYQKAVSSDDSTGKASALTQLKQDLQSEQTSVINSILGSSASASDVGNNLLSTLYNGSSGSGSGSILNTLA